MHTTGVVGVANGATALILSPPAQKKFEVLTLSFWGTSTGGGINVADEYSDGAGLVLPTLRTYPAGLFGDSIKYDALLIRHGDTYSVVCNNTTGGITLCVTYMDVDL
jgi:hypothetical protein